MSIQEKLFYARCITLNRFRFSYGRKPKGDRLKAIDLPPFPDKWIKPIPRPPIDALGWMFDGAPAAARRRRNSKDLALVPLDSIFGFQKGHGLVLASLH